MLGREFGWPWWVWLMMAAGAIVLAASSVGTRHRATGGMPLIDLALLEDRVFIAGMCATFCFFLAISRSISC